jgi:hypothetical protein
MRKHFNTPGNSLQSEGNELYQVFNYLNQYTATSTMVATALNIHRPNLCRYKRLLEKAGYLTETQKGICKITGHRAAFLTTNPALFPIQSQLNLFK